MSTNTIQIEKRGRRFYALGDTYSMRSRLKDAGFRWDPDTRAWWTGKKETADQFCDVEITGVSYRKLDDGTWGVLIAGPRPEPGATVTVIKASGEHKTETVAAVLSSSDSKHTCSIERRAKQSLGHSQPRRQCRVCRGPVVNAPHHQAMEGYCGECAFDEFDC